MSQVGPVHVSPLSHRILSALGTVHPQPLPGGELLRSLNVPKATLARHLLRLQHEGLISRQSMKGPISLAPAGLSTPAAVSTREQRASQLAQLSQEESTLANSGLALLQDAAQAARLRREIAQDERLAAVEEGRAALERVKAQQRLERQLRAGLPAPGPLAGLQESALRKVAAKWGPTFARALAQSQTAQPLQLRALRDVLNEPVKMLPPPPLH